MQHVVSLAVFQVINCCFKLDFTNVFNTLHRDNMLKTVEEIVPSLLPFVPSSYCSPSSLFWEDKILDSADGVQQGDPLGSTFFDHP